MAEFDKSYWQQHWAPAAARQNEGLPVNPYLPAETSKLTAGTALDAGCGTGTEVLWLAEQGWQATGADISAEALATARARSSDAGMDARIDWVEADLTRWEPGRAWDLVVTNYAHADIDQLAFYRRIASWVAPGGTLLIVGHLHGQHQEDPGLHEHRVSGHSTHDHVTHDHPEQATAALKGIASLFSAPAWRIDADYENTRTVHPGGQAVQLRDVIVRAHRQESPLG